MIRRSGVRIRQPAMYRLHAAHGAPFMAAPTPDRLNAAVLVLTVFAVRNYRFTSLTSVISIHSI